MSKSKGGSGSGGMRLRAQAVLSRLTSDGQIRSLYSRVPGNDPFFRYLDHAIAAENPLEAIKAVGWVVSALSRVVQESGKHWYDSGALAKALEEIDSGLERDGGSEARQAAVSADWGELQDLVSELAKVVHRERNPPESADPVEFAIDEAPLASPSVEAVSELPRHVYRGAAPVPPVTGADALYGNIECPRAVLHEVEFDVVVRLQSNPPADMRIAQPIERPARSFTMIVQLACPGFEIVTPGAATFDFEVTEQTGAPSRTIRLRSNRMAQDFSWVMREITALLSCNGQVLGYVKRSLYLTSSAETQADVLSRPEAVAKLCENSESGPPLEVAESQPAPDVSVHIDETLEGHWCWRMVSRHPGISRQTLSRKPDWKDATTLVSGLTQRLESPGLMTAYTIVCDTGRRVADLVPQEIMSGLYSVSQSAAVAGRPVSILFMSEMPLIPWELLYVEENWTLRPESGPLLGAQACVSRWFARPGPPRRPPVAATAIQKMVILSGTYNSRVWRNLEHAIEEADTLTEHLAGKASSERIRASKPQDVTTVLADDSTFQAFHIALHGRLSDPIAQSGLVLPPGGPNDYLDDRDVRSNVEFKQRPFLFLNACQVGGNYTLLELARGITEAFLIKGAGGVVAPLWKVDDSNAKDFALKFYQQVMEGGASVPEALRRLRERFTRADPKPEYVAYQLYGHPELRLTFQTLRQETMR